MPCWRWEPITQAKSRTSRRWQARMSLRLPTPVRHTWKASARLRVSRRRKARFCRTTSGPDVAVLNADDNYLRVLVIAGRGHRSSQLWFVRSADVRADDIVTSADGSEFTLHLPMRGCCLVCRSQECTTFAMPALRQRSHAHWNWRAEDSDRT